MRLSTLFIAYAGIRTCLTAAVCATEERDVVVIGGGSSGTYTAHRLRQHNISVAIVEKEAKLGGHAETYTDPFTGNTIDIGVIVFSPIDVVRDYFAQFDVPLTFMAGGSAEYVDFSTGKAANFTPPSPERFGAALGSWMALLQKYPELQRSFNLTYPVDPDLLLPFGEFVVKHQLQDLVSMAFANNQGYAPLLEISTLYMLKYFNLDQSMAYQQGFLTTLNRNVQELYGKLAASFESDLFLDSTVVSVDRSNPAHVRVLIKTPTGSKLIKAKKIVSTIPPLLNNLEGHDLSTEEESLFGRFRANGYYTAVLNNTGIDSTLFATDPSRPFNVPELPGAYSLLDNQGLTQVYYGSPSPMSDEEVKSDMLAALRRVQGDRSIPTDVEPDWLIFANHSPFNMMVSNEDIQEGFYDRLFALQGQRNTFYNGAAWCTQDSSALWGFTDEYVLPMILKSL